MCLVEANEKLGPAMCLLAFQGRSLYYNIQRYKLVRMRVSVTTKVCGPIVGTFQLQRRFWPLDLTRESFSMVSNCGSHICQFNFHI